MITRIKINGFKTFKNFEIEFSPFTLIAGANGSGKSNLFDALFLLRDLIQKDLKTTFTEQRGEARELFTQYSNGLYETTMSFEVELLLDTVIEDSWGNQEKLKFTRLCYGITIKREEDENGIENLFIEKEYLDKIQIKDDSWVTQFIPSKQLHKWRPKVYSNRRNPYISTSTNDDQPIIKLAQDGERAAISSIAKRMKKTILSKVDDISFLHAFAVKKEIEHWNFLHLNPSILREPSPKFAKDTIGEDGSNLAATLFRIYSNNKRSLKNISREVSNLLPDFINIEIEDDLERDIYIISAKSTDNRKFTSRVLSEGTLRMLVLCILKYDPLHKGLLCFEEPENGVHPFRLHSILEILNGLVTDFDNKNDQELPLRQLISNTHSPVLVSDVVRIDSTIRLMYAKLVTHIEPKQSHLKITKVIPVQTKEIKEQLTNNHSLSKKPEDYITATELIRYLQTTTIE
ncbi:MAG: putative ATPase [Aureispira sp.]|jgi:predicted ATPase